MKTQWIRESTELFIENARRYSAALIAASLGLMLSWVTFQLVEEAYREDAARIFRWAAQERLHAVQMSVTGAVHDLDHLQSLLSHFPEVDRVGFQSLTRPMFKHHGVQALKWVPHVPHDQRARYEREAQRQHPGFQITERLTQRERVPSAVRDRYFPVLYVEPYQSNEAMLGFDLGSHPAWLAVLQQARDSGEVSLTQRIDLDQETGSTFGFWAFHPIYRRAKPIETVAQRRAHLLGFVLGVYRAEDLVEDALRHLAPRGIHFMVHDAVAGEHSHLYLHTSRRSNPSMPLDHALFEAAKGVLSYTELFQVANQTWSYRAIPSERFLEGRGRDARVVFAVCFLLTALVTAYLVRMRRHILERQEAALRLARAKAYTESILTSMADGIFAVDLRGVIQRTNRAACAMVGKTEEELIGASVADLFTGEAMFFLKDSQWSRWVQSEFASNTETSILTHTGIQRPVFVSGSVLVEAAGQFNGAVFVFRDITMQKQVEAQRQCHLEAKNAIHTIAQLALTPLSSASLLQQALSLLLSLPWLFLEKRAAVFLADRGHGGFHLAAQMGLSSESVARCSSIHARCPLCGQTVQKRQGVFISAGDKRRDFHGEHVPSNGHYHVPVLLHNQLWGVLAIYLKEGGSHSQEGESFLVRFAQTLASILGHRDAETQLQQAHEQLRHREAYLNAILENAMDGIISIDDKGRVIHYNHAAEKLFGFRLEQVIGQDIAEFIVPPRLRAAHRAALSRYANDTKNRRNINRRLELPGLRADGQTVDLSVALTTIPHGDTFHATAFLHDITGHKQLIRSLEETLTAAESVSRIKSDFVANMSHEIRTPMNAIVGFTDLMLQDALPNKALRSLRKIRNASHALMKIINDILDFSKIESGKMTLHPEVFSLHDMFDRLADLFGQQVSEQGLDLIFLIPSTWHRLLLGDVQRLEQALINLIRNAVKFTHEGSIIVQAKEGGPWCDQGGDREKSQVFITFSVQDSGIGIDPDRLPCLFEPFIQADASTTRHYGGTGLGLTISKKFIEMMGGELRAESTLGQGSTFSCCLPFATQAGTLEKSWQLPKALHGMRVLLVEDCVVTQEMLQNTLETFSCVCQTVASAEEALSAWQAATLAKRPYGLILGDCRVAGGVAALAPLLEQGAATSAPDETPGVILITAFGEEEDQRQAEAMGVEIFVSRPISRASLFDSILEVFGWAHTETQPASVLSQVVDTKAKIGGASILLVEDNLINQEIALELLRRVGLTVSLAGNGKEAVEMVQHTAFDAVLMDIQMPEMNGYEATRAIRRDARFKDLPIIAMTAHAMKEEQKKCQEAGMNDHLAKPVRVERLYGLLSKWIAPTQRKLPAPVSPTEEVIFLPEIPGIDQAEGLQRVLGNRKLYRDLLMRFREDHLHVVENVEEALAREDIKTAQHLIHTLKGVAGGLGATSLHQTVEALDEVFKEGAPPDTLPWKERLTAKLAPILAALTEETAEPPPPAQGLGVPPVDTQQVLPHLIELKRHLQSFSLETDPVLEQIRKHLHETSAAPTFKKLEEQIEQYAFEAALATLEGLAKKLDLPTVP